MLAHRQGELLGSALHPLGGRVAQGLDFADVIPRAVRQFVGQALARELLSRGREVWNMYGPTETTIWSAVDRVGDAPPMIGQPIGNTQLYVLDPQLQLVPVGAPGKPSWL